MTDFNQQRPTLVSTEPVYTQCTATDRFAAAQTGSYMLHYKNGATVSGSLKVVDQTTQAPEAAAGAGVGWANVEVSAALGANKERTLWIGNAGRFRDANGYVNLTHAIPTTVTLAVFGPY